MPKLPKLIETLLKPESFPRQTQKPQLLQTQMSFVILTDEYVYKIKKAVNLGYLDYSTLESRRHFCYKELELNRRLSPNVYLKVLPITEENGSFILGGKGEPVEYAVKMRRLPQEKMMDLGLKQNTITAEMIEKLAGKVAGFHKEAESSTETAKFGSLETIIQNTEENFDQAEPYLNRTISKKQYEDIKTYTRTFIKENSNLFEERVENGLIKDLHGDLHSAHICFENGISIYDCIEFNDRFRYGDTASEIAFLAMDIDHYGRADLSRVFVESYIKASGDDGIKKLLKFYKCYRAYVRGKVANFKLNDPYISEEERTLTEHIAQSYFTLAHFYAQEKPMLFITTGLTGSGKSTFAKELAKTIPLTVISSDITRKILAGIPETEHRHVSSGSGIYSKDFTRLTYETILGGAEKVLKSGDSVLLDATFIKDEFREKAFKLAEDTGAKCFMLRFTLNDALAKKRLEARMSEETASDGRWDIYQKQKAECGDFSAPKGVTCVIIDNLLEIRKNLSNLLETIFNK